MQVSWALICSFHDVYCNSCWYNGATFFFFFFLNKDIDTWEAFLSKIIVLNLYFVLHFIHTCSLSLSLSLSIYIYIYIYKYLVLKRNRKETTFFSIFIEILGKELKKFDKRCSRFVELWDEYLEQQVGLILQDHSHLGRVRFWIPARMYRRIHSHRCLLIWNKEGGCFGNIREDKDIYVCACVWVSVCVCVCVLYARTTYAPFQ